ncbi:MAG: aminodeoxychorismate synthase component I, partial [Candidatus Zixiibacteriota bacterium]
SRLGVPLNHCDRPVPDLRFLFYRSALCLDHVTGEMSTTDPRADDYSELFSDSCGRSQRSDCRPDSVLPALSKEEYTDRVRAIKDHIARGNIYQANFTVRFDVRSRMRPFDVYLSLRAQNPSTYGAYLNFGDNQVLSVSPERMFLKDGERITTSPVKGTIERGRDADEDARQTARLRHSEKDLAEHVMIVDVERNDLGRIARTGSVHVDGLFRPEVLPSMIHLVSDVSAELRPDVRMSDVFQAMLPGGSITGAPKKRAVEILGELEPAPRSVYTGCIGYIHQDRADFNIAIRTIVHDQRCYHVHAGGGIVADSSPQAEWNEMLLKARNLFRALGVNEGWQERLR